MTAPLPDLRLGFLASHGGTNLQAILDAIRRGRLPASPRVVISNNSGAQALRRAGEHGAAAVHLSLHTHPEPGALDRAILDVLRAHQVNLVVLAGYMKKLGEGVLAASAGRVLNIHPALLPRFGGQGMYGLRVHEAVLAAGAQVTGVSVHLVDAQYDHGPVLAQERVPVLPGDTPEVLQARVLEAEHRLFPEVLRRIALGDLALVELALEPA